MNFSPGNPLTISASTLIPPIPESKTPTGKVLRALIIFFPPDPVG
jgi:hypothetical protein